MEMTKYALLLAALSTYAPALAAGPNSLGQSFVPVAAGTCMIGSSASEAGRNDNEVQHQVVLPHNFEIQTTDVTQAQWTQVMGTNPSYFHTCSSVNNVAMCPNRPVEQVSWDDVQTFISYLNSGLNDGYHYRLPTEAEWECSARWGSTGPYYAAVSAGQLAQYAWYQPNSRGQTHDVATLAPNVGGLYDMEGNVFQWVQDWYAPYDTSSNPAIDTGGPAAGSYRVYRGGCWYYDASRLRSARRNYHTPDGRGSLLGFRLVRTQ